MNARVSGELASWPSMESMASLLRAVGLQVRVGKYSIRVEGRSHFVFQNYGGDLGVPTVDADADTVDDMIQEAGLVSNALGRAGIRHRFEVYNDRNDLCGYLHHEWPA